MIINEDKLKIKSENLKSDLSYYEKYGKPIVESYSKDLDEKVRSIKEYQDNCRHYQLDMDVVSLQRIVMDLSSAIYFTNEKYEQLSLLEDFAKTKHKSAYNEAYLAKQEATTIDKRKWTTDQLRAAADTEAIEDELVHFIYSHAAAVLKSKIDSANEVLKACSKCLSSQIESMKQFGIGGK